MWLSTVTMIEGIRLGMVIYVAYSVLNFMTLYLVAIIVIKIKRDNLEKEKMEIKNY